MLCKDPQGNKYEVKPLRSSEKFRSFNLDEVFLLPYYLTIPLMTAAEGTLSVHKVNTHNIILFFVLS